MTRIHGRIHGRPELAAVLFVLALAGCHVAHHAQNEPIGRLPPTYETMPRELSKVVLPTYTIEPPDILIIEAVHVVPRPPYRLKSLDVLSIDVAGTLPEAPITGTYPVEPGGVVNLGLPYGTVKVTGMTVEEAEQAMGAHLKKFLREPEISVALVQLGASQQIIGEFLVGPDGTVTLGSYGSVSVVGQTIAEAKASIEAHLSQYLENPVISLTVYAFNSKAYYIILQGAGLGDVVYRFPITGNETVLDALAQINGMQQFSSKKVWIARPTRNTDGVQILPVDWLAITEQASPGSNFQILPGDRVFVAEDKWVNFDTRLSKMIAPIERAMGFTLLGTQTVSSLSGRVLQRNRFGGGFIVTPSP